MRQKNLELAAKMISEEINSTIARYANRPDELRTYAWGYTEFNDDGSFAVGPNHAGECFYFVDEVVEIAKACRCQFYMDIAEGPNDEMVPIIRVF